MANNVQKFIQQLITSLGLKRKLSNLFQVLAPIVSVTPGLQSFAPILQAIASWLGVVGVVNAAVAVNINKSNIISTIGAFFSALLLAAQTMPVLHPYIGLITTLATLFSLITHSNLSTKKSK